MAESNPQAKSSRVFLLVAVVLGVLATVTTFAFLEGSAGKERGPKAAILVAARDIKPNTPIDPEKDLKEEDIPLSMRAWRDRAVNPDNKGALRGQRVNRMVLAGQPILLVDLANIGDIVLTNPNSRALAIPAKHVQAVGGLLVPGDWVEMYIAKPEFSPRSTTRTIDPEAGPVGFAGPSSWKGICILSEPVKVLGIGPRLTRTRQEITAAERYQSAVELEEQKTVTVEVTRAQVEEIMAKTGGFSATITFVLVPPSATQPSR
jgi:Flp pilus assembly protein CpaB